MEQGHSIPKGITWQGGLIDDADILQELPPALASILRETNGFILHEGALHVRGASHAPEWHSLRAAWKGPHALHTLYESALADDIPFAQDQLGDQFLLREDMVFRLSAETGEAEPVAVTVEDFFRKVNSDIEKYLNVGLTHKLPPGQLLLAIPPFVLRESAAGASLKPMSAGEVILFHADLARQIGDVPDGGRIVFHVPD